MTKIETISDIVKKYPKIFQMYNGNPYGINWSCPPGWLGVLDSLCGAIQYSIDHWITYVSNPNYIEGSKYDPNDTNTHHSIKAANHQVTCTQVKEKFGGLRFYTNGNTEQTEGMIRMAEYMCYKTCQQCGSTEDVGMTMAGWQASVCTECYEKDWKGAGLSLGDGKYIDWEEDEEEEEEAN